MPGAFIGDKSTQIQGREGSGNDPLIFSPTWDRQRPHVRHRAEPGADRDVKTDWPDQKWARDISTIRTARGGCIRRSTVVLGPMAGMYPSPVRGQWPITDADLFHPARHSAARRRKALALQSMGCVAHFMVWVPSVTDQFDRGIKLRVMPIAGSLEPVAFTCSRCKSRWRPGPCGLPGWQSRSACSKHPFAIGCCGYPR